MKEVIIRNVKKEDIPEVVDIKIMGWQAAYQNIIDSKYWKELNAEREERIKKMEKNYQDSGFIVAELNGKVVGFCRFIDNNSHSKNLNIDCELLALYVHPDYKYQGIGTKLFEFVKTYFKNKKKRKMGLWCLKENEPSKKFYKKMGGTIMEEKEIEIGNKTYKEVCFEYEF